MPTPKGTRTTTRDLVGRSFRRQERPEATETGTVGPRIEPVLTGSEKGKEKEKEPEWEDSKVADIIDITRTVPAYVQAGVMLKEIKDGEVRSYGHGVSLVFNPGLADISFKDPLSTRGDRFLVEAIQRLA